MSDLIKPIDQQSDEELLARLQQVRHNREVVRPAAVNIVAKVEKKASAKRTGAVGKLLEGMSPEEREALIKQLEGS